MQIKLYFLIRILNYCNGMLWILDNVLEIVENILYIIVDDVKE